VEAAERPKAEALGYLDAKAKARAKATADSSAALRNDKSRRQAGTHRIINDRTAAGKGEND
jgi:hypothetical protein